MRAIIDTVSFRGISRYKLAYFLGLLSKNCQLYEKQKIREWHLQKELQKVKELSKNMKKGEELIFAIKDIEHKLTNFFDNKSNLTLNDQRLLDKIHKEIKELNKKTIQDKKTKEETKIIDNKINILKKKIRRKTYLLKKKNIDKKEEIIEKNEEPIKDTLSDEKLTLNPVIVKQMKKIVPKKIKEVKKVEDKKSNINKAKTKMEDIIIESNKKKLILLEKKYEELKNSPYIEKDKLFIIKQKIEQLKTDN
jgi:hypothetical protein